MAHHAGVRHAHARVGRRGLRRCHERVSGRCLWATAPLTWQQELLAWVAPWLVAVALWSWVAQQPGGFGWPSDLLLLDWFGLVYGSACYLAWQVSALAGRQVLATTVA